MATKKISELPLITALSGSQKETLIPVVVGGLNGTTNRITAENFSKFVNAYNATTSSNTFIGAQIINGNLTITGNQVISGRLTVNELVAQYETASIIFSSGSNKFGDELVDKQEFTGSVEITGSIIVDGNLLLNGASLNNSFVRIHQATGSLQNFTSSQADRNLDLSIVTGSINQFTASQDNRNFVISQFTSSTNAHIVGISDFTSSQLVVNTGLASVTASLNNFSGSTNAFTGSIEKTTASIHLATASLNYFYQSTSSLNGFTASQDSRNFIISQYTSSTDAHIVGISDFTSSQLAVNLGNSIYTASVDSHIVGISTYTSSVRDTLARVHQSTASLQNFTSSQADRNLTLSTVTGSLIGITNGLMAFTAALDNTYATDAQLYQLYQATRSIELHSGSMIGITNGLMAYTASNSSLNTGLRGEVDGIEAYTASLKGQAIVSSSTQITNYYKFAETASANTFYGDQTITGSLAINDSATNFLIEGNGFSQTYLTANGAIVLNPGFGGVEMVGSYRTFKATDITADGFVSGEIRATNNVVSSSTQIQNYDVFALNSNLYNGTGSIKAEIAGIEAYTASLKAASIVSSSQQIKDYIEFVNNSVTSSMSVYSASFAAKIWTPSGTANQILYQSAGGASSNTTTDANFTWNSGTSTLSATNIQVPYNGKFQSSLDPTNNISMHDGSFGIMAFRNGGTDRITLYRTTDTIKLSGSLVVDGNSLTAKHQITGSVNVTGSLSVDGEVSSKTLYIGGATTSTGLIGASEAVVQNELGIQFGDATGTYMRMIANTANSNTAIVAGAFSGAEPPLDLIVGGNTQMRLRADGNNGINTTTPVFTGLTGSLTIRKSYNNDIASVPTTTGQNYYSNQSGLYLFGRNSGITIVGGNSEEATICYGNQSTHRFASISAGTGTDAVGGDLYIKVGSDTERLRIGSTGDGNVTVSTGNLVIGTSGKGIDFSATSNGSGTTSSELLNDYETGTWSPQIYYQNATDQTNSTNVTQVGTYTKIGNMVYVSGVLQWTITGSPADDNIGIKNLPFSSKAGADYYHWGLVQLVNAGAYPTDGYVLEMQQNATMMLFYDRRSDAGNYGNDIGASGTKTARFSLTYLSAT